MNQKNLSIIGRYAVTDVKTRQTHEFIAVMNMDLLTGLINGMMDKGETGIEFLEGLFSIVSRPQPTGDAG